MKTNHVIWLVSIFCISLCVASFFPAFVLGATATITDAADKDTYVHEGYPDSNFGVYTYALAGVFTTETEAYFSIPFTNQPEEYTKAEIGLFISNDNAPTKLTFSLIQNTWVENSVTWNTRVTHGTVFNQSEIPIESGNVWFYIDITDLILEIDNRFTFCVNSTDGTNLDHVTIGVREASYAAVIRWSYTTANDNPFVPGYDIVLIGIISVCVIGLIGKKLKIHN